MLQELLGCFAVLHDNSPSAKS